MSDFGRTEWFDARKVSYFMDHASRYLPDRARTQQLLASLLSDVLATRFPGTEMAVLDLGCGDGALCEALARRCPDISLTLLDGSEEMLAGARKRFGSRECVRYVLATFQELIAGRTELPLQHFIVSSFALHHLTLIEKRQMFARAAALLVPGGAFANIDVVLSPAAPLEDWYLRLWHDWIGESDCSAADGRSFAHIPAQYKQSADNLPDTLEDQLAALRESGFEAVDVFFKSGVFAVFGGFRPAAATTRHGGEGG